MEISAINISLNRTYHIILSIKCHLFCEIRRQRQDIAGILHCIYFISEPIIGTGYQGVDKRCLIRITCKFQSFRKCRDSQIQVLLPALYLSPVFNRERPEIFSCQEIRISLDIIEIIALFICSSCIGLSHYFQSLDRRFPQCTYVTLQIGYIYIRIQDSGKIENLTTLAIVIKIIIGEYFSQFHIRTDNRGKRTVGSVHPSTHGIRGLQKCIFIYIRINDLIRL